MMTAEQATADELLTAPDGRLGPHASPEVRSRIALFASGAFFMVPDGDTHIEVQSVLAVARRYRIELQDPVVVDKGVLTGIYHQRRAMPLGHKVAELADGAQSKRKDAYDLLVKARKLHGTSDIIIKCDRAEAGVYAILDGIQVPFNKRPWSPDYAALFQKAMYTWAGLEGAAERGWKQGAHQVGAITSGLPEGLDSVRLQLLASAFDGRELIIRLMPTPKGGRIELKDIGFDAAQIGQFAGIMQNSGGIVIVTGPTGGGKTTTLHGLLSLSLDLFTGDRWITVEDPVEIRRRHPNVTQIDVVRTAVDDDTDHAYDESLSAAMRSIPRRLLFGEIRSEASAAIAIRAALTGHGVLTTLHTDDAPGAIPRLLDLRLAPSMLRNPKLVRAVTAQRLLRRLCTCRIQISRRDWTTYCPDWLERIFDEIGQVSMPNPVPCAHCRGGYRIGRVPISEIMIPDERLLSLLIDGQRDNATHYWKAECGGRPIVDQALQGIVDGRFDPMEVIRCLDF
jgi:type II secretory ATPase GspE/PulE/Tfp pilus assembly ATPase PilB-like protein